MRTDRFVPFFRAVTRLGVILALVASLVPMMATAADAAEGDLVWARSFSSTGSVQGFGVAVDGAGNVYTAGWFSGTVDFDPGAGTFELTASGSDDAFVSKLGSAGDLVWAKSFSGSSVRGFAVAVDGAGNVYTTGSFSGTADFDPGPGTFELTRATSSGDVVFVSKLDSAGNFVWAKSFGASDAYGAEGFGVAVDGAGNVYTTGRFYGTGDFDPGPGTLELPWVSGDGDTIFLSKLDSVGNLVWVNGFGSTVVDEGLGVAVDDAGNVYTTGYFGRTVDFDPGPGVFELESAGGDDVFVSKLDSAGNLLWASSFGGTYDHQGHAVAVDGAGNVYITGTFRHDCCGPDDVFVSKLDSAGTLVWTKEFGGTGWDRAFGVAVDGAGNAYTTGYFSGTVDLDPGPDTFELTSAEAYDAFVSNFDSAGDLVWAKSFTGAFSRAFAVAVDGVGNVYTTGSFGGTCCSTADFDPGPGTFELSAAGSGSDAFVVKLSGGDHDIDGDGFANGIDNFPLVYSRCLGRQATIMGTDGPDILVGTPGADVIMGLGGDDMIRGGRGRDRICAGDGDDTVSAGRGRDRILGEAGDDILRGGRGVDVIRGGEGDDFIRGGRGPDRLYGGAGADITHGGRGVDLCEAETQAGCELP